MWLAWLLVEVPANPFDWRAGDLRPWRACGPTSEIVDLYAVKFDPVFRARDVASYINAEIPASVLAEMDLGARVMDSSRGRCSGGLLNERCVIRRPKRSPR